MLFLKVTLNKPSKYVLPYDKGAFVNDEKVNEFENSESADVKNHSPLVLCFRGVVMEVKVRSDDSTNATFFEFVPYADTVEVSYPT